MMLDVLYGVCMFGLGVWNGWTWRGIIARRRLRQMRWLMRHSDGRDDAGRS